MSSSSVGWNLNPGGKLLDCGVPMTLIQLNNKENICKEKECLCVRLGGFKENEQRKRS